MFVANKEDFWYAHLRPWNNIPLFPREYGLNRTLIYKPQYFTLLANQYNKMDCYSAVYSIGQIEKGIYDTLFLEARDNKSVGGVTNLDQVIIDRDMIRGALQRLDITYRCHYSGGRSYHFYTDFPPIPVGNLSALARNFVHDIDIADLLDMHTVGNKKGVSRIPYTLNPKQGKYAVCSLAETSEDLEWDAVNGLINTPPVMEQQPTSILKYLRPGDDYVEELMKSGDVAFDGIYPDCVLNIMTKLALEKHANHEERIHLAAFLYRLGYSVEQIVDAFREASDFSPSQTEYYVTDMIAKNYRPYSCKRVKDQMAVCPFAKNGRYCHYIASLPKMEVAQSANREGENH